MNNVDKDIEQFEKNLVEINMMKEQISNLGESLKKMVSETTDINEIKVNINKEITTLNNATDSTEKIVKAEVESIKEIATEVKKSIGKDIDLIVNPLTASIAKISDQVVSSNKIFMNELNEIKKQINDIHQKNKKNTLIIQIMLAASIFLLIIVLAVK